MPRHLIRRYSPDHDRIRNHKHVRMFGRLLHDANLWHLNRRSVSGAFAVGLFWAMIPIPFQMIAAAATAIGARTNLPVSVALVWISNPITMPPIFYFCYRVGNWILPAHQDTGDFQLTIDWIFSSMGEIWQPLYLGSLVVGSILAFLGYATMRLFWRWHVLKHYKLRQEAKGRKTPSDS